MPNPWTPVLICIAAALAGCASGGGMSSIDVGNRPTTLLVGAEPFYARSLAMGSAKSKGWRLLQTNDKEILLERDLDSTSPQAVALGLQDLGQPHKLRVRSQFSPRADGVLVVLDASIVANPGSKEEKRVNVTDEYRADLERSLSSLNRAWLANRDKITSPIPLPDEAPEDEPSKAPDVSQTVAEATATPASPAPASIAPAPVTAAAVATPPAIEPTPRPASPTGTGGAPIQSVQLNADSTPTSPSLPPAPTPTDALPATPSTGSASPTAVENEMLVLAPGNDKGIWSYYAEQYASLRGCRVGERGAVLMQKTPDFEVHEVFCDGTNNYLLRCQGGICRSLR